MASTTSIDADSCGYGRLGLIDFHDQQLKPKRLPSLYGFRGYRHKLDGAGEGDRRVFLHLHIVMFSFCQISGVGL